MNNKTQEALKMAVEVLYLVEEYDDNGVNVAKKAIQACKEALEPEVELADTISVEDYQKLREQPSSIDQYVRDNGKILLAPPILPKPPKQWNGLTEEEIASIPLNERTVQTVENLLRSKNLCLKMLIEQKETSL